MESTNESTALIDRGSREGGSKKSLVVLAVVEVLVFFSLDIGSLTSDYYTVTHIYGTEYSNISKDEEFSPCTAVSRYDYEIYTDVRKTASEWNVRFSLATLVPASVSIFILGPLTDILGRRVLLVLTLSGGFLNSLTWCLVIYYKLSFSVVLVGQVVYGLTGGTVAMLMATFCCISDLNVPGPKRTRAIIAVGGLSFVTARLSRKLYWNFISAAGIFYPMVTATGLALASVVLTVSLFPEPRKDPGREHGETSSFVPTVIAGIRRPFLLYTQSAVNNDSLLVQYRLLILAFVLFKLMSVYRQGATILYEMGVPFCWDLEMLGYYAVVTGLIATVGGLVFFILKDAITNNVMVIVGTAITAASLAVQAFARSEVALYIVALLDILGFIPIPLIRSLMSNVTPREQQSALFTSIGMMENTCLLLGCLTSNTLYAATLRVMEGFVFLVLAFLTITSTVLLIIVAEVRRNTPSINA